MLWTIEVRSGSIPLDDETASAIDEGLADARRGDFASEAEVTALWKVITHPLSDRISR